MGICLPNFQFTTGERRLFSINIIIGIYCLHNQIQTTSYTPVCGQFTYEDFRPGKEWIGLLPLGPVRYRVFVIIIPKLKAL